MTELEKAKKLLELFTQHKVHFKWGLCGFIIKIHNFNVITLDEYLKLDEFVINNSPRKVKTRVWYSLFRKTNRCSMYFFKKGCYWRRLRWLKFLVKKYKKIELKSKTL